MSNGRQQIHWRVPLSLTDAYDNQTHQREKKGRDYPIGTLVLVQPDLISSESTECELILFMAKDPLLHCSRVCGQTLTLPSWGAPMAVGQPACLPLFSCAHCRMGFSAGPSLQGIFNRH